MKINFNEIKNKLTIRNIKKAIFYFLEKWSGFLLLLLFLGLSLVNIFIWYRYVTKPNWSENRKEEYRKSKDNSVNLNEKLFRSIVEEKERRELQYQTKIEEQKDIFNFKK